MQANSSLDAILEDFYSFVQGCLDIIVYVAGLALAPTENSTLSKRDGERGSGNGFHKHLQLFEDFSSSPEIFFAP